MSTSEISKEVGRQIPRTPVGDPPDASPVHNRADRNAMSTSSLEEWDDVEPLQGPKEDFHIPYMCIIILPMGPCATSECDWTL